MSKASLLNLESSPACRHPSRKKMYHIAGDDEARRVLPLVPDGKNDSLRVTCSSLEEPIVPRNFSIQKLSIESANAPLIKAPPVPFAKTERKRAYEAARFYSECSLYGIVPMDADKAALDAQSRFDKWWVRAKYHENSSHEPEPKRQRQIEPIPSAIKPLSSNVTSFSENETIFADRQPLLPAHQHPTLSLPVKESIQEATMSEQFAANEVEACKRAAMEDLQRTGGDTQTTKFLSCLQWLQSAYASRGLDARWKNNDPLFMDGNWLTLSKPTFSECQGQNEQGNYVYSLARLSFGMFRPTNLICSLQGVFNTISIRSNQGMRPLIFPQKLHDEIKSEKMKPAVRNYE